MNKKKILNLCLFSIALFFCFTLITQAASGCVLGEQTTKDVKGALKIFNIIAPLALLAFTILDAIKAINSGGSFHFGDSGDMSTQKLVSRFVKRMIGVLLLLVLPTLINWVFIFIGVWGEGEGCDLSPDVPPVVSDPYGCYDVAGSYYWGKQSEYAFKGTKVNNDKCGRDEYGSEYKCYQCNSNGTIKKWKSNSDSDSNCPSGYHFTSDTKDNCK